MKDNMTPRQGFLIAVTVLSFLTVTGLVIGCDSDDGPTVTAPSQQYGSIGFGHLSNGYTWNFRYGRTESEARSEALTVCRAAGSTDCQSLEFSRGQCAALAVGTNTRPAMGAASSSSRADAQNRALAQCRRGEGTNCRIGTGDSGQAASACLSSS